MAANHRLSPLYSFDGFTEADVAFANQVEAEEALRQEQNQVSAQVSEAQAPESFGNTSIPLNTPRHKHVFQPTDKASPSIRRVTEQRAEQQLAVPAPTVPAPTHTHTHSVSPAPVEQTDSPGPFQSATSTNTYAGTHTYTGANPYAISYYQYLYPGYQPGPPYPPPSAMQLTMQPGVPVQAQHPPPGLPAPPTPSISSPVGPCQLCLYYYGGHTVPSTAPHHSLEPIASTSSADTTSSTQPIAKANQPRAGGGGRPSQNTIGVLEKLCDEFDKRVLATSKATGLTKAYIYGFINKTCKGQRDLNTWNKFQPFTLNDDNFDKEVVARVTDSSCKYPGYGGASPIQIQTAYASFMAEHGEEGTKKILGLWHDEHEVEISQTKGSRKWMFNTAVCQVSNMSKTLRNKHSIYTFTLMIGGIIGTDQDLAYICQEGESNGFAESGFLFGPRALISLYRAYVGNSVAITYTNNQLAAFACERGLTISGRGIEDAEAESSPTKGVMSGVVSTKAVQEAPSVAKSKEKADILAIVKARVTEGIGAFSKKGNTLYWATITEQCLSDGVQITGYPPNAKQPWALLKLPPNERTCGIKSMSKDDQDFIIQACNKPKGSEYRLQFSRVDNADLAHNRIPLLVTAPDNDRNKTEVFVSAIDGLDAIQQKIIGAGNGTGAGTANKPRVHFKAEDMDTDLTPVSTLLTHHKARSRTRKRKDTRADEEDFDELGRPRRLRTGHQCLNINDLPATRSKVCSQETIDNSDEMASGSTRRMAPSKAGQRNHTQPPRVANTVGAVGTSLEQPKVAADKPLSNHGPSHQTGTMVAKPAPLQTLMMEELRDSDFKPLNLSMKRPAHTADDATSAKKMRPSASPMPPQFPMPPQGLAQTTATLSMPPMQQQQSLQAPQLPSRVPTPANQYPSCC
ncbi:hypothetical protein AAF712_011944 [Marasmius tenuissimus]|uniref:Uncharacterized protein n=1 Tax=Marasmius tenuissimus TaxID=585030 RepID=A0ABR2ZIP3_9AGAR